MLSGHLALTAVAAKLWQHGLTAVEEDLARIDDPVAGTLRRALARMAHFLAYADSERELSNALVLRLADVPELAPLVESYRATLNGPTLTRRWPMVDRPAPALSRVLVAAGKDKEVRENVDFGRCAWSPDGQWLVVINDGINPKARNTVRLWHTHTWRSGPLLDHGAGAQNLVRGWVLPSSGDWLATSVAGTVWVWDVAAGDLRGMFDGPLLAASPTGEWVAVGRTKPNEGRPRLIKVHQMPDGQLVGELTIRHDGELISVARDGSWLAIGHSAQPLTTGKPGRVELYRMPDGHHIDTFPWPINDVMDPHAAARRATDWPLDTVTQCVIHPEAAAWAATVANESLKIHDLTTGRLRHTLDSDGESLRSFLAAPDGSWLAAQLGDSARTRVWNPATGAVRATFACRLEHMPAVAADSSWITGEQADGQTVILDLTGGRPDPALLGEHSSLVRSYAVSPDSARLAASYEDGTIWLWDVAAARTDQRPNPRRRPMSSCVAAPDGTWLATTDDTRASIGDTRSQIAIWDVNTGQRRQLLDTGERSTWRCVVAPDGSWLATAHPDEVLIWEVASGALRHRIACTVRPGLALLSAVANYVDDLAVAPDGTWLAAACEDGTVRILDVATGQTRGIHEHPIIDGRMLRCVIAPDGSWLAYSGVGGTVVHDLSGGKTRLAVKGNGKLLGVSPDGSLLASEQGFDIRVWDATTGESTHLLRGHTHFAGTCVWSPDGTRLASVGGDSDRTVRIWAAASGELETTIRFYGKVADCCWLPEGRGLCVVGQQGLHVFDLTPGPVPASTR